MTRWQKIGAPSSSPPSSSPSPWSTMESAGGKTGSPPFTSGLDPENSSRSCYSYVTRSQRASPRPDPEDSSWSKVSVRSRFDDSMRSHSEMSPAMKSETSHPLVQLNLDAPEEITYFKDTIFVGGLPHNAQRTDVIKRFAKFGKIKKLVWPMIHDKKLNRKRPKGFAYVIFKSASSATASLEAHAKGGIYLPGFPESKLGIDRKRDNTKLTAQVRERRQQLGLPDRNSCDSQRETAVEVGDDGKTYIKSMVFCGSIPHDATRENVEALFSQFGKVKKIVWPQTLDSALGVRRHKGFCYVIFFQHCDSLKAVKAAKENGGHLEIKGEQMVVERKLDRPIEEDGQPGHTQNPGTEGEINYRDMYESEKAKNEKLLQLVRDYRRTIQKMEKSASRMAKVTKILQGGEEDESPRSWRNSSPQVSVAAMDNTTKEELSKDLSELFPRKGGRSPRGPSRSPRKSRDQPRASPIPGRWSQFRGTPSPRGSPMRSPRPSDRKASVCAVAPAPGVLDLRSPSRSPTTSYRGIVRSNTAPPAAPQVNRSNSNKSDGSSGSYTAFGTKEMVPRSRSVDGKTTTLSLLGVDYSQEG